MAENEAAVTRTVKIEVVGGVAYVVKKPVGVRVEIRDLDNTPNGAEVEVHNEAELIFEPPVR